MTIKLNSDFLVVLYFSEYVIASNNFNRFGDDNIPFSDLSLSSISWKKDFSEQIPSILLTDVLQLFVYYMYYALEEDRVRS